MKRNKKFFDGKTWSEIFSDLKFEKHLEKLQKKFKNKKIALYGAGIMLDYIIQNYDMSGLNIIAAADKKFALSGQKTYKNYPAIAPADLKNADIDIILITTQYPYSMLRYLKKEVFAGEKIPEIYFILNKPLILYIEEIFSK